MALSNRGGNRPKSWETFGIEVSGYARGREGQCTNVDDAGVFWPTMSTKLKSPDRASSEAWHFHRSQFSGSWHFSPFSSHKPSSWRCHHSRVLAPGVFLHCPLVNHPHIVRFWDIRAIGVHRVPYSFTRSFLSLATPERHDRNHKSEEGRHVAKKRELRQCFVANG